MALGRQSDTLEEMASGLRRAAGIGGLVGLLGVAALACASFGAEDDDPRPDGGSSTSASSSGSEEASATDARDAQQLEDAPPEPPVRPCVPYGSTIPPVSALEQRVLYQRSTPEAVYPFAITTDPDFVYWVEQHGGQIGSGNENAYDGKGLASILRISRAGASAAQPTTLATGQAKTMAIARDGNWVYWATEDTDARRLRRVSAACAAAPCTVEDVGTFTAYVIRLVRPRPGLLFGLGLYGDVFRIDTTATAVSIVREASTSPLPGIAATPTGVYFSSKVEPNVQRTAVDGGTDPQFATVDGQDAGDGVDALSTDCDALWGVRANANQPYRVPLGGGTMSPAAPANTFGIFDTAADERYLYLAAGDGRGFHVLEKAALTAIPFTIPGSYWRIAHDEQGIYLGEHSRDAATAGRITMLVKR